MPGPFLLRSGTVLTEPGREGILLNLTDSELAVLGVEDVGLRCVLLWCFSDAKNIGT